MTLLESLHSHALEEFESSWDSLLSKSLDTNPFVTYEWLKNWSKYFGRGNELKLFTVRDHSGVTLAAPICYSSYKTLGSVRRKAGFIGAPDSDYHVFLIKNLQAASTSVNSLLESIVDDSGADCLSLDDVPEDSATSSLLQNVKGANFTLSGETTNYCPFLSLPNNFDSFLKNLGSNMRRNLKVWEREALKEYRVRFVSYSEIGTLEDGMKTFFKLHQKRQVSKGDYGVFTNEINQRFHMEVADSFVKKGWLALYFLTFNDEPVATIYGFEYKQKMYAYLCGFNPDFAMFRPGYLVFKKTIENCIKKNFAAFDFLRGDEEYKSRWKAIIRNNLKYTVLPHGLKSRFYNWNREKKPLSLIPSSSRAAFSKLSDFI